MPDIPRIPRRDFLKAAAAVGLVSAAGMTSVAAPGRASAAQLPQGAMTLLAEDEPFALPPLPYAASELERYISARTISYHYDKHTAAYFTNASELAVKHGMQDKSLAEIMKATAGKPELTALFNNAAQAWNHAFYWKGMRKGSPKPPAKLAEALKAAFGSFEDFRGKLLDAGKKQFGSGWAWLAAKDGKLEVLATPNAENPLTKGYTPLLVVDVWEHAYYLDYQNRRADYLDVWFDALVDWEFAAANLPA